eukprot:TRINITY_DN14266_c0_g1_i1.p1 TRINITY_DN14266_c0_g1~~TRINITY_DN14266_c0_g1_i1.p1  ORF type:complete len:830 (+),score=180.77 TRINITY_DN14266_c0_g1_i1:67-2490(+)
MADGPMSSGGPRARRQRPKLSLTSPTAGAADGRKTFATQPTSPLVRRKSSDKSGLRSSGSVGRLPPRSATAGEHVSALARRTSGGLRLKLPSAAARRGSGDRGSPLHRMSPTKGGWGHRPLGPASPPPTTAALRKKPAAKRGAGAAASAEVTIASPVAVYEKRLNSDSSPTTVSMRSPVSGRTLTQPTSPGTQHASPVGELKRTSPRPPPLDCESGVKSPPAGARPSRRPSRAETPRPVPTQFSPAGHNRRRRANSGNRLKGSRSAMSSPSNQSSQPGPDPIIPVPGLYGQQGRTWHERSMHLFLASHRAEVQESEASPMSVTRRRALRGSSVVVPESIEGITPLLPAGAGTEEEQAFAVALEQAADIPWEQCTGSPGSTHPNDGSPHCSTMRASPAFGRRARLLSQESRGSGSSGSTVAAAAMSGNDIELAAAGSEHSEDGSEMSSPVGSRQKLKRPGFGPPPSGDADAAAEIDARAQEEHPAVDLGDLELPEVPPALFIKCCHLVSLDLEGNRLTELPDAISELPMLERLSVKSNKLKSLPETLGMLENLTHLYLDQNQLTELPDSCRQLTHLTAVGLDWNDLASFPVCLCPIPSLSELFLCENPRVATLPSPAEVGWHQMSLHVDNSPDLVDLAAELEASGRVTVEWNKVFPDKVLPHVFLGSLRSAQDVRVYKALNITHIASIGRELSVVLGEGMEQIQLNVDDLSDTDLSPLFEEVHRFVDEAAAKGGACLVHCFKGQSRSATMVCTYLMRKERMLRDDAVAFVRARRPMINPNPGFMKLMAMYEVTLGLREAADAEADVGT